jgi:hypothetical protein
MRFHRNAFIGQGLRQITVISQYGVSVGFDAGLTGYKNKINQGAAVKVWRFEVSGKADIT